MTAARYADIRSVERRAEELAKWLEKTAPDCLHEQHHLEEGSQERAYWHYGYMMALRDVLKLLTGSEAPSRRSYTQGKSSSHSEPRAEPLETRNSDSASERRRREGL